MSDRQFIYACDASQLEGKQGKLQKDSDGYYEHLVGAFNIYNNVGDYYKMTDKVAQLFSSSSQFISNTKAGKTWGECDHPSFDEYAGRANAVEMYLDRLRDIRTANAACHFKGFRLEKLSKQERGQTVIGVYGHLKPMTEALENSLDTPSANTCFSVRSFINKHWEGTTEIREVKELITYDWVSNGGVSVASKYATPSLESALKSSGLIAGNHGEILITPELLSSMEQLDTQKAAAARAAGLECDIIMPVTRIRDASGWREVPTFDLGCESSTFRTW